MDLIFKNDLNTEISQKLTLTPEMIQSLNILQYTRGELVDYIYDMMMENPVIELEDPDYIVPSAMNAADNDHDNHDDNDDYDKDGADDGSGEPNHEGASDEAGYDDEGYDFERWDQEDWYHYADHMGYDDESYYGRYTYDTQDSDRYDYSAADDMTLEDNLLNQVELTNEPYLKRAIAVYIIQTLDDNGYMTLSVKDISEELGVSEDDVFEALQLVWSFEPPGVGARDLAECLELQLRALGRYDDTYELMLRDHLEDIAMNRLQSVARTAGISVYEVQDRADFIRSLEPKPGSRFASQASAGYIVPDVTVEDDNGVLTAVINSESSPRVTIRNEYRNMLRDSEKNSGVAVFLTDRFNKAMWLVRSIQQRNDTITRVTQAIADHQKEFFEKGRAALKPLTMKEIAEELGIHESTVSRAVNGKYMQSSQGVYELRYFFSGTGRFVSTSGEAASAEALKVLISSMIAAEDRTRPMSDRSIAEAIMIKGVEISRRTVAKYREELGIPSSSIRRRLKA